MGPASETHAEPDRAGRPVNLATLVRRAAESAPRRCALVAGDHRLTWAELDAAVDALAAGFSSAGLVAGFRVGLALTNSVEFVTAYFAALRAGLVAVPLDPGSSAEDVARVVRTVTPRLLLADASSVAVVRTVASQQAVDDPDGGPLVVPVGVEARPGERAYDDLAGASAPAPAIPPADPEALAAVLFTSGTTGVPRPAMLTHRALLANLDQIGAVDPPVMRPDDVVLGLVPFWHAYGLNAVLGMAARAGATLVLADRPDSAATLELVARENVTVAPVLPQVLAGWARRPDLASRLASVRLIISGAAPLPAATRQAVESATSLVVQDGYGLTEAGPAVTSTLCSVRSRPPEAGAADRDAVRSAGSTTAGESSTAYAPSTAGEQSTAGEPRAGAEGTAPVARPRGRAQALGAQGSVGAPLPGVEIRITDPSGADVDAGEPGQVLVRGQNLFSGYWPDGADAPGEKGWFATGDVGYLDSDGELVLLDRLTDLVTVSGFHVYPREVADVIAELPAVDQVAVVPRADEHAGQAVEAYVVPRPGREISPDEVLDHCARRLARFKRPSAVHLVPELPRVGGR